jgi:tetratricopeptide (TPR) repeat protein
VLVHATPPSTDTRETQARLEQLAERLRTFGMYAQMQTAFYLISYIHYHGGDWARAERDTNRAREAGRSADTETAVRGLANSGRCLASIERDHVRARDVLHEARTRGRELGLELLDVAWGFGILAHHTGDLDSAVAEFTRAIEIARREGEHWPLCDSLVRLACLELERGRLRAVRHWCEALAPVAIRLGDASEGPFGDALMALADLTEGRDAHAALEAAVRSLADRDAKGARAYVLVAAAELDAANDRWDDATRRASDALHAAEAVGRRSEAAIARVMLARAARARGDDEGAVRWLDPVIAELARPFSLSARAVRAYEALQTGSTAPVG